MLEWAEELQTVAHHNSADEHSLVYGVGNFKSYASRADLEPILLLYRLLIWEDLH